MKDFTHDFYKKLLKTLANNNFQFITVADYFRSNYNANKPFIMIRHDVDRKPSNSLAMAKIEKKMRVKSTYYFRTIPQTLKADIIKKIATYGHEIGYHYECLSETNGDYKSAIKDFEMNLSKLNKLYPIKNIAMHGRPLSKWDSRLLWDQYDYKKYGILSESYFDIDFDKVLYITDAGRCWNNASINLRDKVSSSFDFSFFHTKNIIHQLNNEKLPNMIMINIHPEHWSKNKIEWYSIFMTRMIKNFMKRLFFKEKIALN
jgi:hypothetical protein